MSAKIFFTGLLFAVFFMVLVSAGYAFHAESADMAETVPAGPTVGSGCKSHPCDPDCYCTETEIRNEDGFGANTCVGSEGTHPMRHAALFNWLPTPQGISHVCIYMKTPSGGLADPGYLLFVEDSQGYPAGPVIDSIPFLIDPEWGFQLIEVPGASVAHNIWVVVGYPTATGFIGHQGVRPWERGKAAVKVGGDDWLYYNETGDSAYVGNTPSIGLYTFKPYEINVDHWTSFTSEDGDTAEMAISLNCFPNGEVVIDITSSDPTEGVPIPSQVVFNPLWWDTLHTVAIVGQDDPDPDGDILYSVHFLVTSQWDTCYDGYPVPDVNLINLDNEYLPGVLFHTPAQNELSVPVGTDICVTFNSDMDEATINNSTFIVNARSTGRHQGTISYDSPTKTATFDPVVGFDEGEVVTVVLTTDILSSQGSPLGGSYSWSFTTTVNDGSATFTPSVQYVVGGTPGRVFSADLDGDGDLDLATANPPSDDVSVLLNDGTGAFIPHPQSPFSVGGDEPWSVFAADLDGDGDLDLATANRISDNVSILLNDGTGAFPTHAEYAAGDDTRTLFAADLDGDGDLDVAIANFESDNVSVLLNNGSGTFAFDANYSVGDGPTSVFAADLDGDGDLDVTTANVYSDNVSILLNNGNGILVPHPQSPFPAANGPYSVFVADFDGDGDLDVATANLYSQNVSILLNDGTGTFPTHTEFADGHSSRSLFAADLDGDSDLDIALANRDSDLVSVLLNDGNGTFAFDADYSVGDGPTSVFAADLDGDGALDLATANPQSDDISVLFNQAIVYVISTSPTQNELDVSVNTNVSATFNANMDETTIDGSTFIANARSTGLHQGTINYDSQTKTATLNPTVGFHQGEVVTAVLTTGIQSLQGTPLGSSYSWSFTTEVTGGSANFLPEAFYPAGNVPTSVVAADLDDDGDLDLITADLGSDEVSVLRNYGNGTFAYHTDYPVAHRPFSAFAADLDGDGDIDLATANRDDYNVSVLLNNGNGTFAAASEYSVGNGPHSVFAADFDGDGDIDLATANSYSDDVSVLLNNGNGTFAAASEYLVGVSPHSVFAADFDGDGNIDLATANSGSDNVSVLLNNGNGTFAAASEYLVGDSPWSVFAADIDGDGHVDLATANTNSDDVSVLLNDGTGAFAPHPQSPFPAGYTAISVFAADLDGDKDLDLAVANNLLQEVSVLLNDGTGAFGPHPQSPFQVADYPYSVFAADLDGGGGLDLAVAVSAIAKAEGVSVLLNVSYGDANEDGVINSADIVYLINCLFVPGSPCPDPLWVGDVNCDDVIDAADVVCLINHLFAGGPMPCCKCKATSPAYETAELYRSKTPAQVGFSSPTISKDGIFNVPVIGKFDVDLAAVQLEIKYDPEEITFLEPALTPRTEGLTIYSSSEEGIHKIDSLRSLQVGILDLSAKHYISAGTGALVNLKMKASDVSSRFASPASGEASLTTSLEITKAILVDRNAQKIPVNIVSKIKKSEEDFVARKPAVPQEFSLSQNYPNPFNPETEIKYALPQDCDVKLTVYNIAGQKVKTLVDDHQTAGFKTVHWYGKDNNGKGVASGFYFYKLQAGDFSQSRKMVLVR